MLHRIRTAYMETNDLFDGEVEVDESYFGGKEGNKHNKKKQKDDRGHRWQDGCCGDERS